MDACERERDGFVFENSLVYTRTHNDLLLKKIKIGRKIAVGLKIFVLTSCKEKCLIIFTQNFEWLNELKSNKI